MEAARNQPPRWLVGPPAHERPTNFRELLATWNGFGERSREAGLNFMERRGILTVEERVTGQAVARAGAPTEQRLLSPVSAMFEEAAHASAYEDAIARYAVLAEPAAAPHQLAAADEAALLQRIDRIAQFDQPTQLRVLAQANDAQAAVTGADDSIALLGRAIANGPAGVTIGALDDAMAQLGPRVAAGSGAAFGAGLTPTARGIIDDALRAAGYVVKFSPRH